MIQDEIENFPQSQANSSSFRLVKTNETLPSIIEAQVVENISPKKITKNGGEFNEIQTTNSTNVWYLSPSGSETNEISASAFKSSNANISNIFDKKNATLKKIATSSTLNSYGGKSSSVYSRLTNTTNNSSPRRSQQNTVKITANSSNDAANRFKSASLQSSLLAKRQSTCLSLNNDETIQDKRKVSMTTSSTNANQMMTPKPIPKPRQTNQTLLNRRSSSLNKLNGVAAFVSAAATATAQVEITKFMRPKTSTQPRNSIFINNKNPKEQQKKQTSSTSVLNEPTTNETTPINNNGLNEFTFLRIIKWLQDIDSSITTPQQHTSLQINDKKTTEYALSDYDSADDQIIEYNRVVDKTFHVVHDENV